MEEAHYCGARQVFSATGARLLPVRLDADGIRVNELIDHSKRAPIGMVYVTPSHQMPTGVILSYARRIQLVEWASQNNALILEDDFDGDYRYFGAPIQSLQGISGGKSVIHVGSFSRSISPTVRIGYLIAPPSLVSKFEEAKWFLDRNSPLLLQETLAMFIAEGHFERHLRRLRARNSRRRAALLDAIAHHFGESMEVLGGDSGIHILARFRDAKLLLAQRLIAKCATIGVTVYPAAPFFLDSDDRGEIILGYGALREEAIRDGIRLLKLAYLDCFQGAGVKSMFRGPEVGAKAAAGPRSAASSRTAH